MAKRRRRRCKTEQSRERGEWQGKGGRIRDEVGGVGEGLRRTMLDTQRAVPAVQSMMMV